MKPLNIVIADDETLIRMDICEILEEAGHQVVGEAPNGKKALELVRKLMPDLIILDVKMPVMDGLAAAKTIAEENLGPVLMLTAFSQPELVEKASESGVYAYLVKPIAAQQLLPAIEMAMAKYQEMQELESELFKVKDSLENRKTLDRAKGILMDAYNLTESEAFRRIQKYSMAKRKTIKEIAEAIIRSATK